MSKVLAFANHKGGVSKTTSVANIGALMTDKGYNVLLIDLDPQANLTDYFLEKSPEITIYDVFNGGNTLPRFRIKENKEGVLDLIPSSLEMLNAEAIISKGKYGIGILRRSLERIRKDYDFILLDCPPSLGLITLSALYTATDLYIPTTAETIPVRGLQTILSALQKIKRQNTDIKLSGIIITRWENRKLNRIIEGQLKEAFGEIVLYPKIRENIAIAEAPATFQDIKDYSPSSNGARDYGRVTEEIIKRSKN